MPNNITISTSCPEIILFMGKVGKSDIKNRIYRYIQYGVVLGYEINHDFFEKFNDVYYIAICQSEDFDLLEIVMENEKNINNTIYHLQIPLELFDINFLSCDDIFETAIYWMYEINKKSSK